MGYRTILRSLSAALLISASVILPGVDALAEDFIFSAPPRGTPEKETTVYGPIATYLSKTIGKNIVYKHPDNWLNYQNRMQKGQYDLVFDGPHFIGWRMAKVQHQPLVRLPGKLAFVVFVKKDNASIKSLDDLHGRTVCGLAPPNLATLTLYQQFPNPVRQPLVVEVKGFPVGYQKVSKGQCAAGVMRDKMFAKLQKKNGDLARVIWRSRGNANQGFSAGPRFSASDKQRIASALMAPEAAPHLGRFFDRFSKNNKTLQEARPEDYAGLGVLLRDVWGFEQ